MTSVLLGLCFSFVDSLDPWLSESASTPDWDWSPGHPTSTLPSYSSVSAWLSESPLDLSMSRALRFFFRLLFFLKLESWLKKKCGWCREKERNVLFNDALNTFYLQLYGVRYMVKDHSDSEKGNPLPPHRLLLSINSKGSFICTIPQTG